MPIQVKKVQLKLKDGQEYKDGDLLFNVDAQAWTKGTRNGVQVPVPANPDDKSQPHKENNAAYYAEQAANYVENAQTIIGAVKDQAVAAVQAQETTSINAVQSQQTTSVNAVTAAGENAIALFPDTYSACNSLASDFAPVYVANQAYNIGDYVTYQYQLYKCNTKILENQDSTFVTAHWTTVNTGDQLQQKVNIYDKITADQLMSTTGVEDKEPYNFRASDGGADIGDREADMVVGGTLVWNQLANIAQFTLTAPDTVTRTSALTIGVGVVEGHKYLLSARYSSVSTGKTISVNVYTKFNGANTKVAGVSSLVDGDVATVFDSEYSAVSNGTTQSVEGNLWVYSAINDSISGYTGTISNIMLFDLTQMFNPTIANYVYSLEQSSAGSGVKWFRKLFPNDYYAYDAGTLRSVQTSAHKMVGFNAYDNTTGTARLLGGMQYQISGAYAALAYSTGETITPDANGKFTPGANGTLTVTGGDATTTCVHLVWDGERDGEYEPYVEHTYPLDDSLELRGIPKLDANNKLRYDGDTYASDGTVTRKYSKEILIDGGVNGRSFSGAWSNTYNGFGAYLTISGANRNLRAISDTFTYSLLPQRDAPVGSFPCQSGTTKTFTFILPSTVTDLAGANEWASAHPIRVIVALETPTTESADLYTNPQIVSDWGTEEYVDAGIEAGARDVAIPVGHETFYPINLREKLEKAPDNPNEDGNYIVKQENGVNIYIPFDVEGLIEDVDNLKIQTEDRLILDWEQGSYAMANGVPVDNSKRIRCNIFDSTLTKIVIGNGYALSVYARDANYNYVGVLKANGTYAKASGARFTGELDFRNIISANPTYHFAFIAVNVDDTLNILPSEGSNIIFVYGGNHLENTKINETINDNDDNLYSRAVPVISKYLSLNTLLGFEKKLGVHHDNFHRENSSVVGQNGTSENPMEYEIISNTDSPSMITGIEDNRLINSGGEVGEKRILAVDAKSIPYKIEANIESGYTGCIVLNVYDIDTYLAIEFTENEVNISNFAFYNTSNTFTHNAGITSISCYVYHDKVCIYAGGELITVDCKITSTKCGMLFKSETASKYTNFCVFQLAKMINVNYDGFIENAKNVTTLLGSLNSIYQQDSCTIQSLVANSKQALKFNLDYDGTTKRTELSPNIIREKRFPLTTHIYSFDVYFPDDFTIDTTHEIFFQMHGSGDGIVPCIALKIDDDNICISIKGASNRITSESTSDEIDHREEITICPLSRGKWINFVLFYKAGYMEEHDPITALFIDGELKVLSRVTNAYNEPLMAYPKYGIYKAAWGTAPSSVAKRTLYYDNFQIWE